MEFKGKHVHERSSEDNRPWMLVQKYEVFTVLVLLLITGTFSQAQNSSPARSISLSSLSTAATLTQISSVVARDANGRIAKFKDQGNRLFDVSYDDKGVLRSSRAVLKEHIADVVEVRYDELGRLEYARLGAGFTLSCSYMTDGTQIVRDRFGGYIIRRGTLNAGYSIIEVLDPSNMLAPRIVGLDTLMRAVQ